MASPTYLLRNEAAQYVREKWGLRCAPRTLAKLACIGGGPAFRIAGRSPLYEPEQLDSWAQSRIGPPVRSTSDRGDRHPQARKHVLVSRKREAAP